MVYTFPMDIKEIEQELEKSEINREIGGVFSSRRQYLEYLLDAYRTLKNGKAKNLNLDKIVPHTIDAKVTNSVKAVKITYPRYTGEAVVLVPSGNRKLGPKKKNALRKLYIDRFSHIPKKVERDYAENLAISYKLIDDANKKLPRKRTKKLKTYKNRKKKH